MSKIELNCPMCGQQTSREEIAVQVDEEALADLVHVIWSDWTRHFFSHQTPENITRWQRQLRTDYLDLSEEEKEKDRVIVRKIINRMLREQK